MRLDLIIVAVAIAFLAYTYFNDTAAVEMLWENIKQWLANAIAR